MLPGARPTPPPPQICVNAYVTCTYDGIVWEVRAIPVHHGPIDHGIAAGGFPVPIFLLFAAFAAFLILLNLSGRVVRRTFAKGARKASGAG